MVGSAFHHRNDAGEVTLPAALGVGLAIVVVAVLAIRLAYGAAVHEDKPRVLVIGDSITDRGQKELKDELGPSYSLSIDGKTSFRIDQQIPSAERWASRDFSQVIVNLGTNDAIQDYPLEQSGEALKQLVAEFAAVPCVHLVTINEQMPPSAHPDAVNRAKTMNFAIRSLAAQDPRIRIVDWASIVNDVYASGTNPTVDGVHPTPEGAELLAKAYDESLSTCKATTSNA